MDNFKIVEQALVDAEVEVIDQELPADKNELEDDEEKVTHSPKLILHRIKWIGDQITRVSFCWTISFVNLRKHFNSNF